MSVAVCCIVLHGVAGCCRVLQGVAGCYNMVRCDVVRCGAVSAVVA